MYPVKKTCSNPRCGKPFETTIPGQTECLTCLLRPSRLDGAIPEPITEDKPGRHYKDRQCDCGNTFTPTGPRDKTCPECRANKEVVV